MMNPTDEHLRRFLVRYGEALSAGDLKAISGCYAVPSLVLSDEGSVPIAAEDAEAACAASEILQLYAASPCVAVEGMGSWVPIRLGGRQFPDPILHVGHDLSSTPSMRLDESSRMLFRWKGVTCLQRVVDEGG
jgi:hypothetical protein